MKINFNIHNTNIEIEPYTSKQERDLLFLSTDDYKSYNKLDLALSICGVKKSVIKKLTDVEKKALLLKFREISVGDTLPVKFTCTNCKTRSENEIKITNIVEYPTKNHKNIENKGLISNNIFDYLIGDYKEMDLDVFLELKNNLSCYITKFNFKKPCICQRCLHKNLVDISNTDFIIDNLSEETLTTYYKAYQTMIYLGHFSKIDIDSLLPFERTIHMSLLSDAIKGK